MKLEELYVRVTINFDKAKKNKEAIEKIIDEDSTTEEKAILLHGVQCNANHTDGCGWLYEVVEGVHNWGLPSHKRWLSEAQNLQ